MGTARKYSNVILATIFALCVATLSLFVFAKMVDSEQHAELQNKASQLLDLFHQANAEIRVVLASLNEHEFSHCTQDNMIEMRKALFKAEYIKDIGFFEGTNLVCTTGLGRLETPKPASPPDFYDSYGNQVWSATKLIFFKKQYEAIIYRDGLYNIVLDPQHFNDAVSEDYIWQFYANENGETHYYAGEKNFSSLPQEPTSFFSAKPLTHTLCDDKKHFCLQIHNSQTITERNNTLIKNLASVSSVSIGIISYFGILKLLRRRNSITGRVQKALAKNQFCCVYQPIVELDSGKIIGVEMLTRLTDNRGVITPDQFIEVIRKLDRSWEFTQQIIEQSLRELSGLAIPNERFKVSFNIYPCDVINHRVMELPKFQGISEFPGKIVLEIIESEYLEESVAQKNLTELKNSGFGLAIDDFGTGYSNLNHLKKIKGNILKIDRSFVFDVEDASIRSSLITHIVTIAHEAEMDVVAEGVEKNTQHQALKEMGVEFGQGWAFGKPMPIEKLAELLAEEGTTQA